MERRPTAQASPTHQRTHVELSHNERILILERRCDELERLAARIQDALDELTDTTGRGPVS